MGPAELAPGGVAPLGNPRQSHPAGETIIPLGKPHRPARKTMVPGPLPANTGLHPRGIRHPDTHRGPLRRGRPCLPLHPAARLPPHPLQLLHSWPCPALSTIFSPSPCYLACLAGVYNWPGRPHLLSAFSPFPFPFFSPRLRSFPSRPPLRTRPLSHPARTTPPAAPHELCLPPLWFRSTDRRSPAEPPAWGPLRNWSGLPRNWIRWWPGRAR